MNKKKTGRINPMLLPVFNLHTHSYNELSQTLKFQTNIINSGPVDRGWFRR